MVEKGTSPGDEGGQKVCMGEDKVGQTEVCWWIEISHTNRKGCLL